MFQLRFLGGLASQRRAFLAAEELAPYPLHSSVKEQLELLADPQRQALETERQPTTRWQLFILALRAVIPLVILSSVWNAIMALVVLAGVAASRSVLTDGISWTHAVILSLIYLSARVAQSVIDFFDWRRRAQINRGLQCALFRLVNRKISTVDRARSTDFSSGQLKTLVASDVESVEDFLSAAVGQWVPALVTFAVLAPALYYFSGTLGLVALLLALASLPWSYLGARVTEYYQSRAQRQQDELTNLVGEWTRNIRLVRFLGWQQAIEREIAQRMRRYAFQTAARHTVAVIMYGVAQAWWMVPVIGMFIVARIFDLDANLVVIFSSIWILEHLMLYLQHIPYSLSMYGSACAGADRVLRLLAAPDIDNALQEAPNGQSVSASSIPVAIKLREACVVFDETVALDNLSLTLALDRRTAIVGEVASGKSILLDALVGERALTSGSIEVVFDSGEVLPLWRADVYESMRSRIAYGASQPFLSNTLMRWNIDLGGSASDESIRKAADRAQLTPDIEALPKGLDEEVGEIGINLSGGQKQRVSLARAFLSARPIFVLDDPLSAVDPATEAALMDELIAAAPGLIMVSHRLQELTRCDRILVLEGGKVVEDGTPTDLIATPNSRFNSFLQAGAGHHE